MINLLVSCLVDQSILFGHFFDIKAHILRIRDQEEPNDDRGYEAHTCSDNHHPLPFSIKDI
jgi:hypothetical protein